MVRSGNHLPGGKESRVFDYMNMFLMLVILVTTIYPFWYILVNSFNQIDKGGGLMIWPNDITLSAYKLLFINTALWYGYKNTVIRTVLGTLLTLAVTSMAAYPLTKRDLPLRGFLANYILLTMLFSGGLIPTYMLIKNLGILNSVWALVLPNLCNAYNLFIIRNFYRSIPESLEESARLDGANWFKIWLRIILPLSKPVLATISLWVLVWHWNSWFDAMIYITDAKKTVVQAVLRKIVIERNSMDVGAILSRMSQGDNFPSKTLESAMIVITIIPMLIIYPFIQKYFVKGIMIGSIKG